MSNHSSLFLQGDAVYYTGNKFKQELSNKEGKPFKGWIHAPVINQDGAFVVWFPDTKGSDSYILSGQNLSKARPPKAVEKDQDGPIIEHMPSRRKRSEEES
jgi:hypothetical protein